jgi:DNA-binding NtrC family response regulator
MMTANEGGRHKAYAEHLGVCQYLRKPFAMDIMLDAVEKALSGATEADGDAGEDKPKRPRKKSDDE